MAKTPRFAWQNGAAAAVTVITASDEQSAFPARNVGDPSLAKTWRSKVGWTVTAGLYDKIDVLEGGVARVATIAAGSYTLATDEAGAVQAALNAMPGAVNTYTCTYNAATHKFTIARATGAATVSLLWSTGANAFKSAGKDLGFSVAADDTGATSYIADFVAYQSRKYLDLISTSSFSVDIVLGENDAIDIDNGGVTLALITPGHYSSPTDLAAAVDTAFAFASPTPFLANCVWNDNFEQKFRILNAGPNFTLKWSSGANKARSIGPTLGYNVSDDSGASAYYGDSPVYGYSQVRAAFLIQHNMRFQGTVKLLGDFNTIGPFPATSTQTLVGTDKLRLAFMPLESYPYRRLLIEDVQNSDGFSEVGVLYFGPYYEAPDWLLASAYGEQHEQLSGVFRASRGAFFQDRKPQAKRITGALRVPASGKASLEQLQEAVRLGAPFFFAGDPANNPRTETFYVVMTDEIAFSLVPESGGADPLWDATIKLVEDLP